MDHSLVSYGLSRRRARRRSSISGSSPPAVTAPRSSTTRTTRPSPRLSASSSCGRAPEAAEERQSRSSPRSSDSQAARVAARSISPRRRTAAVSPTRGPRAATTRARPCESIGLLVVSGDEAAADENVRALAEQAEATIVVSMYGGLSAGWADLLLPGTSYLERDGTFVNLEGRLQRLRRTVEPPCLDELDWISQLAARFDVAVAPYAAAVFAEVSERVYGGLALGEVGERAPLRVYPEAQEHVGARGAARAGAEGTPRRDPARCVQAALLRRGRRARHGAAVPAAAAGARDLGRRRTTAQGQDRRSRHRRLERECDHAAGSREPAPPRRDRPRRTRARERAPGRRRGREDRGGAGVVPQEPWWIAIIEAIVIVNILLGLFAYLTLIERKVMGRMQLRYGPNRAGPYGLLQPIADLVKLVRKEAFAPSSAIELPYILAPVVSAFTAIAAFSFIPWGPGWTVHGWRINGEIANVSIGLDRDLRARLDRDLRLHRRRLGVGVEVLDPRLDAHVRAARLVRGLARAQRARRRHPRPLAQPAGDRRPAGLTSSPTRYRSSSAWSSSSSPGSPRRAARRSTCPRPSRSSSPATTPSTRGCAGACSRWPSTST